MKYRLCAIIAWFGPFPKSMNAFLYSCKRNHDFNWIIFSDSVCGNLPTNVKLINMTLSELKKIIEEKVGFSVSLERPYKICDFRPAFGKIFEDYLQDYDFWGYGDIDVVYGNLSHFINDEICEKYDKIYPCGHLSYIRNREDVNLLYKKNISGTLNYLDVFTSPKPFIFDEYLGMNEKMTYEDYNVYGKIDFADRSLRSQRFKTVDKSVITKAFPHFLYKNNLPRNYKWQVFMIENGNAYRVYIKHKKIIKKELVYIHYRLKFNDIVLITDTTDYYVTMTGLHIKKAPVSKTEICRLNPYLGFFTELKERLSWLVRDSKIMLARNEILVSIVGKIKSLFNSAK